MKTGKIKVIMVCAVGIENCTANWKDCATCFRETDEMARGTVDLDNDWTVVSAEEIE